ncbi:DUF6370 family protein [Pedobacter sandarakinus]|uniref:DUF6370 family protein n=1 Tax=Pedobacter sandarakinus TaxID=353156 RepID=UPI0022459FD4|nr:DUF6370 family protein [Pedobacter sandarakinus]MCX2575945.1 DUF6370 family protein [Pedobacter sandarakinus]
MKNIAIILFITTIGFSAQAQVKAKNIVQNQLLESKEVDIACGECRFKMKGKSCDLAIRVDGKTYFVDGKHIDDFGDAHGEHGFCNAISKAAVTGKIVNNRFKASKITLLK